jgi:hypothetical protein
MMREFRAQSQFISRPWVGMAAPCCGFSAIGKVTSPLPVRYELWGLPAALSVIRTWAILGPLAEGVNVTVIVQFAPAVSMLGQLFVCEKSGAFMPAMLMLLIDSDALPLLVKVR